ncbi:hypothetical protein NDU88_002376 [Pleurodeles waltl]|uniref:Uncharacterized protein n=1 Tax=Pleurodeles waltl TaxID=8319 RepID=A0AAV7W0H3_PLEWA|nr:hypothetical protein NDU88_002376 [Pleurodeles waltl]
MGTLARTDLGARAEPTPAGHSPWISGGTRREQKGLVPATKRRELLWTCSNTAAAAVCTLDNTNAPITRYSLLHAIKAEQD